MNLLVCNLSSSTSYISRISAGVISGSEGAIRTSGHLDHDAYKNLSSRVQPTFAVCRDAVYELFLSYLKRKQELGDFDIADRLVDSRTVFCLLKQF